MCVSVKNDLTFLGFLMYIRGNILPKRVITGIKLCKALIIVPFMFPLLNLIVHVTVWGTAVDSVVKDSNLRLSLQGRYLESKDLGIEW